MKVLTMTMMPTITHLSGELESLLITIIIMRTNIIHIILRDRQFLVRLSKTSAMRHDQYNSGNPVINPLAAMVAPLAALALIAAASAVSVNPMLMSIATISRSRRHTSPGDLERQERGLRQMRTIQRGLRQMRTIESFLSSLPSSDQGSGVADRLTLSYLECGELVSPGNHCLQRVVCLYTSGNTTLGGFSPQERDVVSMYDKFYISIDSIFSNLAFYTT